MKWLSFRLPAPGGANTDDDRIMHIQQQFAIIYEMTKGLPDGEPKNNMLIRLHEASFWLASMQGEIETGG